MPCTSLYPIKNVNLLYFQFENDNFLFRSKFENDNRKRVHFGRRWTIHQSDRSSPPRVKCSLSNYVDFDSAREIETLQGDYYFGWAIFSLSGSKNDNDIFILFFGKFFVDVFKDISCKT